MIIALQTLVFFRESLLTALHRLVSPYYKRLKGSLSGYSQENEEDDEEVFAEFDDEKGVVFYPPMYAQRYAAVSDCLMDERWCGKLVKVVDLGYHDMSFIKYLKDLPGVECILGVDIESIPLRCSSDLLDCNEYTTKREAPLQVTLFQGNAADPDYRLIGCDAVVAIEMIEHMLPHDLDRLVHTVFGFIKPWIVIFTTPNADFNELFKSLEKNGLRRWDHFFEWTREQFHDWCSNIVVRYPQFTVTCQGVGPGPPGTEHHGCCSQLALFVNKNYVKQQELNPNSLALISNVPSPQNLAELVDGWDSPTVDDGRNIVHKEQSNSFTNCLYSNKQSCVTLILSTPAFSMTTLEYHDKTSQCNLDTEVGKNFIMFNDEEMYFTILIPRRKVNHRVYEIEDVNSRLNCTTFHSRKFSKTTQNLMAKNKSDSLAHTREVVNEIQHLTKMLNYKRDMLPQTENRNIWCNINWGDNAPYWNNYYKVIRDYSYPFEQKSDECRIIDLISEEINRLVDLHFYQDLESMIANKLEIPIEHLMGVVSHITNDVDKVKDLLEWNGYEVVGNFVIHSRLVVDTMSVSSWDVDWPENETTSERDSDTQSTIISEASAVLPPDHLGRCIRRALDKKVHTLRSMLSADEDITSELDLVVCKLMKLALQSSKGKQKPPPATWMQFKLLDLLTLTEKAIARRKRHFIESFSLHPNDYHDQVEPFNRLTLEDRSARMIMDKYNHLLHEADNRQMFDPLGFGFEDEIVDHVENNEYLKDYDTDNLPKSYTFYADKSCVNNRKALTTKKCLEAGLITSGSPKNARKKYPIPPQTHEKNQDAVKRSRKRAHSKIIDAKHSTEEKTSKSKKSRTSLAKTILVAKRTSNSLLKVCGKKVRNEYGNQVLKTRRPKEHKKVLPTASKPIPGSLIELCDPGTNVTMLTKNNQYDTRHKKYEGEKYNNLAEVAATEESVLIDIIMDDMEETIALKRSIGTEANMDAAPFKVEPILGSIVTKIPSIDNKLQVKSDNVQSQTIFLYDINEPSTSKGIRHLSMDVQCGTDAVLPSNSGLVAPRASPTRISNACTTGIRIKSPVNVATEKKSMEFGTSTDDVHFFDSGYTWGRTSNMFSKGIKIKDSQDNLQQKKSNFESSTDDVGLKGTCSPVMYTPSIKIKDSLIDMRAKKCSDFCMSTNNIETDTYQTKRAESPRRRSKQNSKSELRSLNDIAEDLISALTPRSNSPENFRGMHADDSLANLLMNFNPSTEYQNESYRPSHVRSLSVHDGSKSPGVSNRLNNKFDNGIKIRDSSPDAIAKLKIDCTTSTKEEINFEKRSGSPIVYTRVKMIDLVSDVTIEQDAVIKPSPFTAPEPSRLLSPRYGLETPTNFRCKKNDFLLPQQNKNYDISSQVSNESCKSPKKENKDKNTTDIGDPIHFDVARSYTNIQTSQHTVVVQSDDLDNMNKSLIPSMKSYGFKVKDSEENVIKKVEFSTTRVELVSEALTYWPPQEFDSLTKTDIPRSVSSKMKMAESTSELFESNFCTSPKSLWHTTNSSLNTSDFKNKQSYRDITCEEKLFPTKIIQRKLSCGGVHIHSFKEKLTSQDIVYQGQWERTAVKYQKKKFQSSTFVIAKKAPDISHKSKIRKVFSKEKAQVKIEKAFEKKKEPKEPTQVRNTRLNSSKRPVVKKNEQTKKVVFPNQIKAVKSNSKTKVASKLVTSSITSRNVKSIRNIKKFPDSGLHVVKNDFVVKSEPIKRRDLDTKYLPSYLRKKYASCKGGLDKSIKEPNKTIIGDLDIGKNEEKELVTSKNEKFNDLLEMQIERPQNTKYLVFRNEIEKTKIEKDNAPANNSHATDVPNRNDNMSINRKSVQKRSSSPTSLTSSTCSASNSIATVKANNNWNRASRRHSASSNKSSTGNTESQSESPPNNRNRKFSKKFKNNKKTDSKDYSNKENVPESPIISNAEKESLQNLKNTFIRRSKNLFMAQLEDSSLAVNSKHQITTKSNVRIPAIESNENKKGLKNDDISNKKSLQSHNSKEYMNSEASNVVLLIDSHQDNVEDSMRQHTQVEEPVLKGVDSGLLKEWFDQGSFNADRENTENAILAAMRQIVEERLDFIGNSLNESVVDFEDNSSIKSYKTVVPVEGIDLDNTFNSQDINEMTRSFNAFVGDESDFSPRDDSGTDMDMVSFKSINSASKYSEYYMAESDNSGIPNIGNTENKLVSSVLDIFERKNLPLVQNTPGPLAVQAFSGFSMDVDRVMGDQPEYISSLNSDRGSFAVDVSRQATSEEMFISGRSSETYESCIVEEEVAVPDWLFHVMNPHLGVDQPPDDIAPYDSETGSPAIGYERLHVEDNDQHELVPLRMPMVEPVFDVNGNVLETGIGFGAGAGDGRGMHSDHSQDSSGRGSSLSSTDASSGPHSEALLIDPSAFTTQFELFHEPVGSSMALTTLVVPVGSIEGNGRQGRNEGEIVSTSRSVAVRERHLLMNSDGEADVSSLDTDVPDSS